MQVPAPRIDVILDGFAINTSAGLAAMCEVVLIEGAGADGRPAGSWSTRRTWAGGRSCWRRWPAGA